MEGMKENCGDVTVLLLLLYIYLCMHVIHEYLSLALQSFISLSVVLSQSLSSLSVSLVPRYYSDCN